MRDEALSSAPQNFLEQEAIMKIKFLPQNIEADVDPDKSALEAARELGIPIQSSCNGMCACGDCRVFIEDGEGNVFPPTAKEMELTGRGFYVDQRRLACQLYCFGPVSLSLKGHEPRKGGGAISKEFLERSGKEASDTKSRGGILIEEDQDIRKNSESRENSKSRENSGDGSSKVKL